jgi:hypothetical protein
MRKVVCVAALVALGGCETFDEAYTVQSETIIEGSGVRVFEDLQQDMWGGEWLQYRATNLNDFAVCVQVRLNPGARTSGHSMGSIIRVPGGETVDVGYVTTPASFNLASQVWATNEDDVCGYPPAS